MEFKCHFFRGYLYHSVFGFSREHMQLKQIWSHFEQSYVTFVSYCCVARSRYKVLHRRIIWMTGQWINVKFAPQTRPVLYQVLLKLMSAQEDLVVSNDVKYEIQASPCILCSPFVIQGSLRVRPTSFLTSFPESLFFPRGLGNKETHCQPLLTYFWKNR